MLDTVGPSHHIYYGSLHRRRLWLAHLAAAYGRTAGPQWLAEHDALGRRHSSILQRVSMTDHLGILSPLPLAEALDDRPVDSFLLATGEELAAFEQEVLSAMSGGGQEELEETSTLWGRTLAQESMMAGYVHGKAGRRGTVRGLFEAIHAILAGGEFHWLPMLVRRYTDRDLEYELMRCPHRHPFDEEGADRACRLEAMVYKGFTQVLAPAARFERIHRGGHCMDAIAVTRR